MTLDPLVVQLSLTIGLSFFFGLAFEEFHAHTGQTRPGGIRTFPLLALSGALLYLIDPARKLAVVAGLLVLGAWLVMYYRHQIDGRDPDTNVELVAPICNVLAYLIGPAAVALPPWVAVAATVASVLLLTARERLHAWAEEIDLPEITTAAKFLILTGIVLPLLPNEPVTTLTAITPMKAWLALLAVCTLSYASYLLRRFLAPTDSDLAVALLGGLYSSTATTVVLARAAAAEPSGNAVAQAGIILATGVMYLRILVVIAIFDLALAMQLAPVMIGLSLAGLALAAIQYRRARGKATAASTTTPRNPLELTAAAIFAVLFVAISIATVWVRAHFGAIGVDALALVVGFTDIDPFVLSLAQGSAGAMPLATASAAILIAAASNNVLKAVYTISFAGWRASLPAAGSLVALAAAGVGVAFLT
jgi:uncharacterized membrane protein (DUF4010 family)